MPALEHFAASLERKAAAWDRIIKIGRTHLADATPLRLGQEVGGLARHLQARRGRRDQRLLVGGGERGGRRGALGGGVDLDISSRFALRVLQVDYMHTTLFNDKQNNLRFSTGLVYHWGTIRQKGHRAPVQNP